MRRCLDQIDQRAVLGLVKAWPSDTVGYICRKPALLERESSVYGLRLRDSAFAAPIFRM